MIGCLSSVVQADGSRRVAAALHRCRVSASRGCRPYSTERPTPGAVHAICGRCRNGRRGVSLPPTTWARPRAPSQLRPLSNRAVLPTYQSLTELPLLDRSSDPGPHVTSERLAIATILCPPRCPQAQRRQANRQLSSFFLATSDSAAARSLRSLEVPRAAVDRSAADRY